MAEKVALLVIDMVKDNLDETNDFPIREHAEKIIKPINRFISKIRKAGGLIVFSNDSYHREDFIFKGKMKPHAICGTIGAELIEELDRKEEDLLLPKPRFSAFFGTDLNTRLREKNVTLCAVAGISTHFCVLTTAMDAICHDFKTVILTDCTAAFNETIHKKTFEIFTKNPLYPLFRMVSSEEFDDL